ncbi:MAG: LysR family transcriptional regulator [Bacilli bacterium]|nr:LysR family transcriptional regulator [Bacilli bacterium]
MNDLNMNSLKIFLEVANSNSFLEASNKLYVSQPAISKSMSKLEEDLNVTLFYRANKGISLTPSGEILYNYLKKAEDLLLTCQRELTSINDIEESSLVIGVQSHIVRNYLMNKIDDFRLKHPKIKIELIDMSTNQLLE